MPRTKRSPSAHQKQMRFFTIFFGAIMVLIVAGLIWVLNRYTGLAH